MRNAHQRFGTLEFTKRTKDSVTQVRVYMDRFIAEPSTVERGPATAHLISVVGGDAEIGSVWAAIIEGAPFKLQVAGGKCVLATLGLEAQCFRGSIMLPALKRPIRHLVAVSAELAKTRPGADREGRRTVLCDGDPLFILYRVSRRFGLPVVPQWAPWLMGELEQRKAIRSLIGLGCSPVLVEGGKQAFLSWIRKGLKRNLIRVPEKNDSISWKLPPTFLDRLHLPAGNPEASS